MYKKNGFSIFELMLSIGIVAMFLATAAYVFKSTEAKKQSAKHSSTILEKNEMVEGTTMSNNDKKPIKQEPWSGIQQ